MAGKGVGRLECIVALYVLCGTVCCRCIIVLSKIWKGVFVVSGQKVVRCSITKVVVTKIDVVKQVVAKFAEASHEVAMHNVSLCVAAETFICLEWRCSLWQRLFGQQVRVVAWMCAL